MQSVTFCTNWMNSIRFSSNQRTRMIRALSSLFCFVLCAYMLSCARKSDPPEPHMISTSLPTPDEIKHLPPDGGEDFNRLIHTSSPYLLQHARNPVDWYPWGEEAKKAAREQDKPIFLSVGYSSCHWCHVMEHESFEDPAVAEVLNEICIPVKVDREERPDIDQIYMAATQIMTGRGGWPNSVFLTPDGRPFYAGTYYPKDRFLDLLRGVQNAWSSKRAEVDAQAHELAEAVRKASAMSVAESSGTTPEELLQQAEQAFRQRFDEIHGGFGGAPKFPPHAPLRFLLARYEQTGDESLLSLATQTLDEMALGGIHDHIGGGFHRYATDKEWFLPHFEKMLYDNGQLAWVYAEAYRITGRPHYRKVVERLLDWVLRDMTDETGGFYSALDADSEGEEGRYYVWTLDEVVNVLGPENGPLFAEVYGFTKDGNFFEEATRQRTGANIPHLEIPLDKLSQKMGKDPQSMQDSLSAQRKTLRQARDERVAPGLDDKILTAWNGLMIGGMAHAAEVLDNDRYRSAAQQAATFLLDTLVQDQRLLRRYRNGEAGLTAYLDDYAFLADGLVDLYHATKDDQWVQSADDLLSTLDKQYARTSAPGYYYTAEDHEDLLTRSFDLYDNATPSGNAVALRAMARLAEISEFASWKKKAANFMEAFEGAIQQIPFASGTLLETRILLEDHSSETAASEALAHSSIRPVRIELFADSSSVTPGTEIPLRLHVEIDPGWHINAHQPGPPHLIPTTVQVEPSPVIKDATFTYPESVEMTLGSETIRVYEGSIDIHGVLTLSEKTDLGSTTLKITINTQACDDKACLEPVAHTLHAGNWGQP